MSTPQHPAPGMASQQQAAAPPPPAEERVYTPEPMPEPEPLVSAAEAQEVDADPNKYVTASLCGKPVRVIPPGAWRQSWQRALKMGDLDAFAAAVIHPDDLDLYDDLDPTNDEFGEFTQDAGELAGESLGKSGGPNRSSRRMRRR